jgi:hypothetical protein
MILCLVIVLVNFQKFLLNLCLSLLVTMANLSMKIILVGHLPHQKILELLLQAVDPFIG